MYLNVLVFRGTSLTYSYRSNQPISVGTHVLVPFGSDYVNGLVIGVENQSKRRPYRLKYINKILNDYPILNQKMVDLILWFQSMYSITPFLAYQTIIGRNRQLLDIDVSSESVSTCSDYALTSAQKDAYDQLLLDSSEQLLFGVTGSGKTELYIHLARLTINQHKSTIILLPEIALTPQVNDYFVKRFGNIVAVLHSGLTPKQKNIQWSRIIRNSVKIIIGPRSAIFAPVHDLGLIIIDEAHDSSYKQDSNPRYHTHTIAQFRAQQYGAKLIYGTATPDISMFHRLSQLNRVVMLNERVQKKPLPTITTLDMTDKSVNPDGNLISPLLSDQINKALIRNEKIILLVNRRGYAPYIVCQFCQTPVLCPSCDLSFTYHSDQTFRCHRCFVTHAISHRCQKCQKQGIQFSGIAIQKVELAIKQQFPSARVIRFDKDSASTPKKQHDLLTEFRSNGDILLGTQMVAKGHHIEAVTLVGVLGMESILNIPDFRSAERAYQLITQVAGRAGRGQRPGHVVLQTFQPYHYAIISAKNYDFNSFYKSEIESRNDLFYPPFSFIIRLVALSLSRNKALTLLQECYDLLSERLSDDSEITDPQSAPIEKQNNLFRFHFIIKIPTHKVDSITSLINDLPESTSQVKLLLDLDPVSIL